MSKSYIIQWKSKVNGRVGRGTRLLDREEAERLAAELNREYPDIHHEPLPAEAAAAPQRAGTEEQGESTPEAATTNRTHSFSTR